MSLRATALALVVALVGSITITYPQVDSSTEVKEVETRLGALVAGSSGGANYSEGSASVAGSLISLTTDVLYLDNTNATGAWYARLESVSTTGLSNVVSLTIGIDNGTKTPQVLGSLGSLTQTTGPYVRLAPSSANKLYVTQVVAVLGPDATVSLKVYAADAPSESAFVVTTANVTIT